MNTALVTDLYELNMAASYLRRDMRAAATFSLFCHRLPSSRGYLVAAGLEDCLDYLESFGFNDEELAYLGEIGFSSEDLERFKTLSFTGEVRAVPEGTVLFAGEPLIEVTAPIAEAQLVETYLLNQASFQSMLATKASRCVSAADGRIELVDFSLRRTQGLEAAMAVARLSAVCGFVGTSNVEAARRYGLVPVGTMAHSYVQAFSSEREAFYAFARGHEGSTTFLVDTYEPETGIANAIEVITKLGLSDSAGIRIDSGDLDQLSRRARILLDNAGLTKVRVYVSGGLDEHDLARFVASGAPIDSAGVGTRLGVSSDAPYLDTAYKLVEYDGRPVMKLSAGKATLPARKQVFRAPGTRDVIGRHDEHGPPGSTPLLSLVMEKGRRLAPSPSITELRAHLAGELEALPRELLDLTSPPVVEPLVSDELRGLDEEVRRSLGRGTASAPDGSGPA